MDKELIEHYQKCKNVYAEMSSDVDYAINDAERPGEYERKCLNLQRLNFWKH